MVETPSDDTAPPEPLPIFNSGKFSIDYLNRLFSRFNKQYENLNAQYSGDTSPEFMHDCFGLGIPTSFATTESLKQGTIKPATRVGTTISTYHTEIRNTGKKWGLFWDKRQLASDPEFAEVLDYVKKCEQHPLPPDLKYPKALLDGRNEVDYMLKKFNALKEVKIVGREKPLPNKIIMQSRGESDVDDGAGAIKYEVSMAAVLWGIREAGMSIKGRPGISVLRQFLQKAIGLADDAGLRMVELHEWAPDVFKDYDREVIAKSLQDQQYWIQTAAAVENILGHNTKVYEEVLSLIGETPQIAELRSANKAAILLYTLTERLERFKRETEHKIAGQLPEGAAQSKLAMQQLNTPEAGMHFDKMLSTLKILTNELSEAGIKGQTEQHLNEAKQRRTFSPPAAYDEKVKEIFTQQVPYVADIFKKNPDFIQAIDALEKYTKKLQAAANLNDETMYVVGLMAGFCQEHIDLPPKKYPASNAIQ